MSGFKLSYFDIEGNGEKVRLAFALAGLSFEDHRFAFKDWAELKKTMKFGRVPVLEIQGKGTFAQSEAQTRYIARIAGPGKGLFPEDPLEALRVDEAIGLVGDFAKDFFPCFLISLEPEALGYPKDFASTEDGKAKVKEFRERFLNDVLPKFMEHMGNLIEESGGFLASKDAPTIADCMAIPELRLFTTGILDHIPATALDKFPVVKSYVTRFESFPRAATAS